MITGSLPLSTREAELELNFLWLSVAILGVWRITHLLAVEDGPGDILVSLRRAVGAGFFGKLLDCFYCLSFWVAVPFAFSLGRNWREWIILWFALSGGACLCERICGRFDPPKVEYYEDE
jgi:hypothetical protein